MFSTIERFWKRRSSPVIEPAVSVQVPYADEEKSFANGIRGHNKYDLENAVVLGKVKRGDKINIVIQERGKPEQILPGRTYMGFIKSAEGNAVRHSFAFEQEGQERFEQHSWAIIGWLKVADEKTPEQ